MKTNAERAQERLTLTLKTEFTLEKDGFIGALYQPERDEYHLQIRQPYADPAEVPIHGHVPGRTEIPGAVLGKRHGRP